MKNIIYILIALIATSFASCDKAFENGDLDGMWKLVKVETDTGEIFPENIYYSFQRHIVIMGIYAEEGMPQNLYMGYFFHKGTTMVMNNFYRKPGIEGECDPAELENLYIYGYDGSDIEFAVKALSNERLVLSTGNLQYYFRKW